MMCAGSTPLYDAWMRLQRTRLLLVSLACMALGSGGAAAELTITTTTTVEGGLSGTGAGGLAPKVVTRISGTKSRTDIDLGDQVVSTIIDTAAAQALVLQPEQKTALQFSTDTAALTPSSAPPPIETAVQPTGKTRDIDGVSCAEYSVTMKMEMAAMAAAGGSALPPETAAMLKGVIVRITGSTWVAKDAPGAADYAAFQQIAAKVAVAAMTRLSASAPGGAPASPIPSGMERLVTGFPEAPGIPYLTELTTSIEGSGQLVAILQGLAQMKITSKVASLSTDPVPAGVFAVPEGYTVVKQ